MKDLLQHNKLKNYTEGERFRRQERWWLRHSIIPSIIANHFFGESRGLQPSRPTAPTRAFARCIMVFLLRIDELYFTTWTVCFSALINNLGETGNGHEQLRSGRIRNIAKKSLKKPFNVRDAWIMFPSVAFWRRAVSNNFPNLRLRSWRASISSWKNHLFLVSDWKEQIVDYVQW